MLEMLFPDERKFYAKFSDLTRTLGVAATSLAEALDDPERLPRLASSVGDLERRALDTARSMEVLAHCRAIKQAEERADAAWETAVTELFDGKPDPLDALRWMSVYGELEDSLDACEDVANQLETITVKHG